MIRRFYLPAIVLFLICAPIAFAQASAATVKTFDRDGLKFEYPADWVLTDKSTADTQLLLLSKINSSVLITLISPRGALIHEDDYTTAQQSVYDSYFAAIRKTLDAAGGPEFLCLNFNGRKVSGARYTGTYKNEPSVGEIYPFVLANRFLGLVYLHSKKDEDFGEPVWRQLIRSIYLEGSHKEIAGRYSDQTVLQTGILNGRALKLGKPVYPAEAARRRITGTVEVSIEIAEDGKVSSAKAVSGNPIFYAEAEGAAKRSRFSPTMICDTAIRLKGVITYNFVR